MKRFFWVIIALLVVCSFSLAEVNQGIRTRHHYQKVVWTVVDTVAGVSGDSLYALDTLGYAIFDVRSFAEQGFSTMMAVSDSTDSLDMWMATGGAIKYFGFSGVKYADSVKCLWTYRMVAADPTKPSNLPFIQSLELVDATDYNLGYMVGDYLKFTVLNSDGTGRDTVAVESGNGTWTHWANGAYHNLIIKVWFK